MKPPVARYQIFKKTMQAINSIWHMLVEPDLSINNPERRRRMRLLSALLVILTPLTLIGAITTTFWVKSILAVSFLLWTSALIFALAYFINIQGNDKLSIVLLLGVLSVNPYITWFFNADFSTDVLRNTLQWTLMAILVGTLFQNRNWVILLAFVNLLAILLIPVAVPQINFSQIFDVLYYLVAMAIIIIAVSLMRELDVRKIEEQSQTLFVEETKLQQLLETNPAVVYSANPPGTLGTTFISSNIYEQLGYSPESFTKDDDFWVTRIHPNDAEKVKDNQTSLLEKSYQKSEYRFKHKDGSYRWMRDEMRLMRDANNEPSGIVGYLVDISDYVVMQGMLKLSQDNFRSIVESNPLGILIVNNAGVVQYSNNNAQTMLKWGEAEILADQLTSSWEENPFQEIALSTNDGNLKTLRRIITKSNWQGEPAQLILLEDITSIRSTEFALQVSDARYKTLSESGRDFIYVTDREGRFQYVNSAAINLFNAGSLEDLVGEKLATMFSGDEAERITRSIQYIFSSGEASSAIHQYTIGGNQYWLDTTMVAITNQNGDVESLMGISRDITWQKRAAENTSRMGQILDDSLNEIFLFDVDDLHFIQVNRGASKNLGYTLTELQEMEPLDIKPKFTQDEFEDLISPLRTGQVEKIQFETLHRRKNGSIYPVEVNLQLISSESKQIFAEITLDITDRSQAEKELKQAYEKTLEGWSMALDIRDEVTQGHSQRVAEETVKLAQAVGLPDEDLVHIRRGALLHDIGKIGIPDEILKKPGSLTDEERKKIEQHPIISHQLLKQIEFLHPALDIPHYHHEKWDGSGYPDGLAGENIPLAARIFAIVDVYDALSSDRPYRDSWEKEKAREFIMEQSGTHFDPKIVEIFFKEIWKE